jgi:ABC-type uncharacterized transport system substrate-binding protein
LRRRDFIILLGGAAAASPLAARPRPAERMRRIGVLMGYPEGDPQAQANITALLQGLQNLGWIEGRDVKIDYRWAGGDPDKARTFARELIAMMPDLMVSSTNQVTRILGNADHTDRIRLRRGPGWQRLCGQSGASRQEPHRLCQFREFDRR